MARAMYAYAVNNGRFIYYGGTTGWVLLYTGGKEIHKITDIDGAAQDFEALGGTPEGAEYGCLFKGYLINGYLYDNATGAGAPQTVQISSNGDIETWSDTFDLNTGASKESFPDAWGWITGLESMQDTFAVFFQNSISLGYFTGYPSWISFKKEAIKGIGAIPNSMVSIGNATFFWGTNDIYVLEGNGNCYGIGSGKVRNRLNLSQRIEWSSFPAGQAIADSDIGCTPVAGDGSDRTLYRVSYPGNSVILAVNEHPPSNEQRGVNENDSFAYVCNHLRSRGFPAPVIHAFQKERGWFILEDLGDIHLQDRALMMKDDPAQLEALYRRVLTMLALMQIKATEGFDPGSIHSPPYDRLFVRRWESGYFLHYFVERYCRIAAGNAPLAAELDELAEMLSAVRGAFFLYRDISV